MIQALYIFFLLELIIEGNVVHIQTCVEKKTRDIFIICVTVGSFPLDVFHVSIATMC